AAVDPAGEDLAVGLDGEADFAAGDLAGLVAEEFGEQVDDHRGRETCRVGVDQEEQRLFAQDRAALGQQFPKVVLEPPHFAAAAPTVRGRIHDDRVVPASAARLAADELQAVVGDVADRRVSEAAEGGVFAAPFHHALGGIDVADLGAGLGGGAGGGAGVTKKVEDGHASPGTAGRADALRGPLPVDRLF